MIKPPDEGGMLLFRKVSNNRCGTKYSEWCDE